VRHLAAEVQAKASSEEIDVLRSLLLARRDWHPKAPVLLQKVLGRGYGHSVNKSVGRRLAASCYDYTDNETCEQMADPNTACGGCKWYEQWNQCMSNSCNDYTSQETCCANANKVQTGCFWNNDTSSCVTLGDCAEMANGKCGDNQYGYEATECTEAKPVCEAIPGCKWNACGGCMDTGMECDCDNDQKQCIDTSAVMDTLMGNTGCALTDCVLCMKRGEDDQFGGLSGNPPTCDEMAQMRTHPKCSSTCPLVIHDDAEAKCLLDRENLCGNKTVQSCTAEDPPASCGTGQKMEPTCDQKCASFDATCNTASPESNCKAEGPVSAASMPAAHSIVLVGIVAAALTSTFARAYYK